MTAIRSRMGATSRPKSQGLHAGCGVGGGFARNVSDVNDFKGLSFGGFVAVGPVTAFGEGSSLDPQSFNSFGVIVGPGAGVSGGILGCKTWAWEL